MAYFYKEKTFTAYAAADSYVDKRFVTIAKDTLIATYTTGTNDAEAVTMSCADKAGDAITVLLLKNNNDQYTVEAAGAVAKGGAIKPQADGKGDDTGTQTTVGYALNAVSAAGADVHVADI